MPNRCDCREPGQHADSSTNRTANFAGGTHVSQGCESPFAPLKWPSFPRPRCFEFSTDEAINAYSPPLPQVCSGLLCSLLILIAGCSSPSSQNLDSLTVTATPSTVSCRWRGSSESRGPSERWYDPGCNCWYTMDTVQHRFGDHEQRSTYRESGGHCNRAGGLC